MEDNELKEFAKEIYGECVKRNLTFEDYRKLRLELASLANKVANKSQKKLESTALRLQDIEF